MGLPPHIRSINMAAAIQRYFDLALYLLLITGFGTLASTGSLDPPTVFLVGGALLFRGLLLSREKRLLIPEAWTTWLTLAYVLFYVLDYLTLSGNFLSATVHLVLFVMVVRLFSAQKDRDYYFLAVLSFLMVLAAAVLTVNSVFLLAFAAFVLMAVITVVLMEMRRSAAMATLRSAPLADPWAHRHMAFSLMGAAPAILFFILLGAAGIFFILPRLSTGYLSAYAPGNEISTGFSDRVELGRIGQIQQSSSPVMHVQIEGDDRGSYELKWRGIALSLFDGKTWTDPDEQHIIASEGNGRYLLQPPKRRDLRGRRYTMGEPVQPIRYRVLMEPVGTNMFFLAPTATMLEGNYRVIAGDDGGEVIDLDAEHTITSYDATSDIARPKEDLLRAAFGSYPPDVILKDLQLPRIDPRIPALAEDITATNTNDYDKAAAIENYLQSHYAYTLQLSRRPPRDPVAEFLFERKQGHCEYFASSMVLMLRSLRIPARIVNGFRGGQFNNLSSQYLIRASDAHSWVEAYFPGYGWVTFDPTPAAQASAQPWSRFALYLDAASSFWREWVVNYDRGHQGALAQSTFQGTRELLARLGRWGQLEFDAMMHDARQANDELAKGKTISKLIGEVALSIFLTACAVALVWWAIRRRSAELAATSATVATLWFERLAGLLQKRGKQRLPAQTAQEFVHASQERSVHDELVRFTRHYEAARFGESRVDAERLPEVYEEIAGKLKK